MSITINITTSYELTFEEWRERFYKGPAQLAQTMWDQMLAKCEDKNCGSGTYEEDADGKSKCVSSY